MRLPSHTYRPKFNNRIEDGAFPPFLLFGFETEMSVWNIDAVGVENIIKDLVADTDKFFYIKYDGSIDGGSTGAEINSHPFNWNFILNHKDYIEKLAALKNIRGDGTNSFLGSQALQFRINRTCGFHIHICKDYFTDKHLDNITHFFYDNKDFIERISLRPGTHALSRFARTRVGRVDQFIRESKMFYDPAYRYRALNICGKDTIEIRIFQGTLNLQCLWAYLEFALAVTLFTEKNVGKKLTTENFINYVNNNPKKYTNFIGLYNKRVSWE